MKKELLAYEQAEKAKNDYLSSLNKKFEDGRAEERAKAELKKAEMKVNLMQDMARNLRSQGVPLDVILLATKLSKEEIESL